MFKPAVPRICDVSVTATRSFRMGPLKCWNYVCNDHQDSSGFACGPNIGPDLSAELVFVIWYNLGYPGRALERNISCLSLLRQFQVWLLKEFGLCGSGPRHKSMAGRRRLAIGGRRDYVRYSCGSQSGNQCPAVTSFFFLAF
ncbi:hypothetical protein PILCRDRAFT_492170 [Piloderma croceum F 1598]|uniref:Uncharacterized protein n=1 Tax=Piloderma croceum (strain F 1598) TaxID=765440 RepID=A0A0C3FRR7_PILCF|nr:hypothetical protein PILCRDRAFT_492170 [Piloderma croceum F 1598]